MSRFLLQPSLIGSIFLASYGLSAAETPELREIRELRQTVESQSKQIEALTAEVAKLSRTIEGQKVAAPGGGSVAPPTPPAAPDPTLDAPKAEAVTPPGKHVVAKGETLTSIAKHHNVSIAELQKVNRIENDRKLQIGQSLTIPSAKPTESQPEKKANP